MLNFENGLGLRDKEKFVKGLMINLSKIVAAICIWSIFLKLKYVKQWNRYENTLQNISSSSSYLVLNNWSQDTMYSEQDTHGMMIKCVMRLPLSWWVDIMSDIIIVYFELQSNRCKFWIRILFCRIIYPLVTCHILHIF